MTASSMTAKALTRSFKMGSTKLPDLDPSKTPDEVRQLWAEDYPHLANSTVTEPEVIGDELVYKFEADQVKTKG